jgi:hypothetical protein
MTNAPSYLPSRLHRGVFLERRGESSESISKQSNLTDGASRQKITLGRTKQEPSNVAPHDFVRKKISAVGYIY